MDSPNAPWGRILTDPGSLAKLRTVLRISSNNSRLERIGSSATSRLSCCSILWTSDSRSVHHLLIAFSTRPRGSGLGKAELIVVKKSPRLWAVTRVLTLRVHDGVSGTLLLCASSRRRTLFDSFTNCLPKEVTKNDQKCIRNDLRYGSFGEHRDNHCCGQSKEEEAAN
jgi:hypothetical protein